MQVGVFQPQREAISTIARGTRKLIQQFLTKSLQRRRNDVLSQIMLISASPNISIVAKRSSEALGIEDGVGAHRNRAPGEVDPVALSTELPMNGSYSSPP